MTRRGLRSRRQLAMVGLLLTSAGCSAAGPPPSDLPRASTAPTIGAGSTSAPAAVVGPERVADAAPAPRAPGPRLTASLRLDLVDDPCVDRDLRAPTATNEAHTILDRTYALPPEYVPADLVPAADAGFTGASGTKLVRAALLEDLRAIRGAWEAAGLSLSIESAYRSYAAQSATFESWAERLGVAEALRRTARPGHSEHQLGTALDLTSPGWSGRFGDWAAESAEGAWMVEHGWEYGFAMSFPAGAEAATCFGYEPWHWRWIGRDVAADHRAAGLPLREFLVRLADG